jgi:predicted TIM-barrel fold metal-dependent hydrolase
MGKAGHAGKIIEILGEKKFALIASLPLTDAALAASAWDNGADAIKLHINVTHAASGTDFKNFEAESAAIFKILENARGPVGIVPGASVEPAESDMSRVIEAGFDFVSIYAHHAAESFLNSGAVKMLAADMTYSAEEIKRVIRRADILEASVVPHENYGERLNLRDIINYEILGEFCAEARVPLVIPTQKRILPREVGRLREAGASAIMIGAIVAGRTPSEFGAATAAFREAIDKINNGT